MEQGRGRVERAGSLEKCCSTCHFDAEAQVQSIDLHPIVIGGQRLDAKNYHERIVPVPASWSSDNFRPRPWVRHWMLRTGVARKHVWPYQGCEGADWRGCHFSLTTALQSLHRSPD